MAYEAWQAMPEPCELSRRRQVLVQPKSSRADFRGHDLLTADAAVPLQSRGPFYGLTGVQINEAAAELTSDVRIAVSGIDASHAAEDDVNADACGAMRKTLARVCKATSYFWEVETHDHRARESTAG